MMDPISSLESTEKLIPQTVKRIYNASSLEILENLRLEVMEGKRSLLSSASKAMSQLKIEGKRRWGQTYNSWKKQIEEALEARKQALLKSDDEEGGWFDVTLPVKAVPIGHLSPDTQIIRQMNEFFTYHGYSIAEGPDIESDEFNFEKTNLPKDHPARDLQDTIYIESPDILLRTHTSNVEKKNLSQHTPPLRFVVPGVCFRNEILNPSNHAIFQQYQGVLVDKNISLANLKATLEAFARHMYGPEVKTRFRTKYYPEVEPGAGMDILCTFCHGGGCKICKGRGWIEILGSGIIHRELLRKCGIDYREWSGFAFGMGLDRIIMTKFGINDIRDLHGGNLVFSE